MPVSINSVDFFDNFDVSEMKVGVVGFGYVGQAVESFFSSECECFVYDKYKEDLNTLEEVVSTSHVIFVCVPTPMKNDGSCHTGIVEEVIKDIKTVAQALERDTNEFIVIVKSTVKPGFTKRIAEETGLRVMFSPEFLTEKNSIEDFENTNRVVLGGNINDAKVVAEFFKRKLANKGVPVLQTESTVAELVKLFTNAFLMTKVLFGNEMYKICEALNLSYEEVYTVACLDNRIAYSHFAVPGHDGQLGAGGHCFPKDINNLRHVAKELGTGEKLFTAVIERNEEVRDEKDWLDMKGRAVIDE